MLLSMTGYGSAEKKNKKYTFNVEVKAINNRFIDVVLKMNQPSFTYEEEIISLIKKKCIRGRVNVNINITSNKELDQMVLNKPKLSSYISIFKQLKKEVNINDQPSLNNILNLPDVIIKEDVSDIHVKNKTIILSTVKDALDDLNKFRKKEGINLSVDINKLIKKTNSLIDKIELLTNTHSRKELNYYKKKIKKNMPDINNLDDERIYQEVAILLEKKDINEEIVRLKSHMDLLRVCVTNKENVGKKINFLLQEMTRETNTIGSKSEKIKINHLVVDIKDYLEKIKEQVQNIL